MPDLITIATLAGAGLAGFFGGKRGSRTGAESTLNGTASAVRRIEDKVDALAEQLGHVEDAVSNTRERLAFIEGRMSE